MSIEANDSTASAKPLDFDKVVRSFTVNVYLPKNLINYRTLIELLGEVLEFNGARQYLVSDVENLLPIMKEQFPDVLTPKDLMQTADLKEIPTPVEPIELLRTRLVQMKKRIGGYSIFEADGAFEHDLKGTTIAVHPEREFKHPRSARAHFENCELMQWLDNAATEYPSTIRGLQRRSACLLEDSSRSSSDTRRILSYKTVGKKIRHRHFIISRDDTVETIDTETVDTVDTVDTIRMRKCVRLLEERTLVIKFIIPVEEDEGWSQLETITETAKDALWDALMLIGCYLSRKLGERGEGLEDEIWISYDFGHVWSWKGGNPKPPQGSRTRARSAEGLSEHG